METLKDFNLSDLEEWDEGVPLSGKIIKNGRIAE